MILLFLFLLPAITIGASLVTKRQSLIEALAFLSAIGELICGILIVNQVIATGSYTWSSYSVDAIGAIILSITICIGFIATGHSIGYFQEEQKKGMIGFMRRKECFILLRLFLASMYLAVVTTNPIIMWIAIEATTLSTVFLISVFNRKEDIEAAWKYLLINSIGLLLGLLGTLLFLIQIHSPNGFTTWEGLPQTITAFNPIITKFAFVFIFIGYGTKMGLVPMHTWKPDAYNKAPLPIVALLSGALLNIAFLAILRFKVVTDSVVGTQFSQSIFIVFGVLSIIIPAFFVYTQTNFKRMLAYSSIEHAGMLLLGFGFGGLGIFASILHMIFHALAKSLLFFLSSTISVKYSSSEVAEVKGMLSVLPLTSKMYIIAFIAISGLPPFGIFYTELSILLAGFTHHSLLTMVILFGLILIFIGFFKKVFAMLFGKPNPAIEQGEISRWTTIPVAILTGILILLSFYLPTGLLKLIHDASNIFLTK